MMFLRYPFLAKATFALAIALGLALCTPKETAADTGQRVVGVVLDYKGRPQNIDIRRGRTHFPVRIYMRLLDGDEVRADGGSQITLRFTDGSIKIVKSGGSPYRVEARGSKVGLSDKVIALLERVGLSIERERTLPTGLPTGVRGGGAAIHALQFSHPGLSNGTAEVVAGKRRLALAWRNGSGPFRVTISRRGGKALLDAHNVAQRQLETLDPRDMTPGAYDVTVEDAKGARAAGWFTVVAGAGPAQANAELPSWLGKHAAAVLRACAASQADRARSSYDAYLSLIDIKTRYKPAKDMRQALLNGGC